MFTKFYKNWTAHNLISHLLSEVVYLITRNEDWAVWIHNLTLPDDNDEEPTT